MVAALDPVAPAASPTRPRARWTWERVALVGSTVLALVSPVVVWWDIAVPGRTLLAVAFVVMVPGVPVALALFPRSQHLWVGLAPAVSLATFILVSSAQLLLELWNPAAGASLLALVAVLIAPRAWDSTTPSSTRVPPQRTGSASRWRTRALAVAAFAAALSLWWWATRIVDLDAADRFGLIEALPWQYYTAAAIPLVVAAVTLRRRGRVDHSVLVVAAMLTAVIVYTFVSVADGGSSTATGYVHVGFADVIARNEALLRGFDARFSWPGFFVASASFTSLAGLPNAAALLIGYPAFIDILLIAPIYTLGLAITRNPRVAWLGVFLYLCVNWVQQDYFSPQSIAQLLYLVVVSTLVWQLSRSTLPRLSGGPFTRVLRAVRRTPSRVPGFSGRRTVAVEAVLLLLGAAMVVSHQLTPVALIVALGLMALVGVTRSRTLWFGVGVVFAAWFAFGAGDWWSGHLSVLLDGFGRAGEAVQAGVVARVRGDQVYASMQLVRIGWSGLIAGLGLIGWLIYRRSRTTAATAILVVAPVALIAGQSYGGEVVLRVFLYASPVLCALAAGALRALVRSPRRWLTPMLAAVLVAAGVMVTLTRGLNTAFERTPADLVAAADDLLETAPAGSRIRPLATEGVLRSARIDELRGPVTVDCSGTPFDCLLAQRPDYVFLTSTRENYERLTNGAIRGWYDSVVRQLTVSGLYRLRTESPHVRVLERIGADDAVEGAVP